jgi:hypothetical protein
MHPKTFGRNATAAALFLSLAATAAAQEVASTLDQLRVLVRPGDSLTVTDATGDEVRGKVFELSSASLVMQAHGQRHEFFSDDIRRITQPHHADLGTGAKWGFGIGAGFGLLTMAAVYGNCRGCGAFAIANTVMFGGVGSGIGVGIAASITDQRLIYSRPALPVKVAVAPLIDRERQGVRVSLRF